MPRPRRYLLRYCLMAYNADQRIPELVEYCRRCGIESVMIHTESHSMHLRHRTLAEAEEYAAILVRCGAALRAAGIEFGLNIWQTLGHHDAAFSSIAHFGWQPMVGHDGQLSARSPCPLDTRWQAHMAAILHRYARCQPEYVLLDDDFRWHNHQPVAWGCYCPAHLELFGKTIGRAVGREELLQLVYGAAYPAPPARGAWQALLRATLEEIAGQFEQAIHAAAPATMIGLMSSAPAVHAAEGRLWHPLLRRLAGAGRPPMSRPCLGCYREFNASEAIDGVTMALQTCALLPAGTRVAPELESSPFTRFNKSTAHLRLQAALSYFCVSPELTLDIHSFSSPSLEEEPANTVLLLRARKYFDRLANAGLRGGGLRGVNVPIVERVAEGSRSRQLSPSGCVVKPAWEACLPQLGIPVGYDDVLHGDEPGRAGLNHLPRALSGDVPLAVPEGTLREWFGGPLLLDAPAAECFALRGLGRFIGATVGEAVGQRHMGAEELLDAAFGGEQGVRLPVRHMCGEMRRLTSHPGARVISRLLWGDEINEPVEFGAGIVLFENELGGRVAVLPYDGQTDTLGNVQFRNYHRQHQLHALLRWLAPRAPFVGLTGAANVAPLWKQTADTILLGLANLSLDPMPLTVVWRNLPRPLRATLESYDESQGLRSDPLDFVVEDQLQFSVAVAPWQLSLLCIATQSPLLQPDQG